MSQLTKEELLKFSVKDEVVAVAAVVDEIAAVGDTSGGAIDRERSGDIAGYRLMAVKILLAKALQGGGPS